MSLAVWTRTFYDDSGTGLPRELCQIVAHYAWRPKLRITYNWSDRCQSLFEEWTKTVGRIDLEFTFRLKWVYRASSSCRLFDIGSASDKKWRKMDRCCYSLLEYWMDPAISKADYANDYEPAELDRIHQFIYSN